MNKRVAVIAGAGPAGLTAALELVRRTDYVPLVFECDAQVGGISKTVEYRGNRMDLGGHRFFSKSDWVMNWWQEILPVFGTDDELREIRLAYQGQIRAFTPRDSSDVDPRRVMLVRPRLSRIYYRRKFFDYPLTLGAKTFANLGWLETVKLGSSYVLAQARPRTPEVTLEDFFVNRFGVRLYETFFRDYTEKVWGVPCREISAEWGAQRVKGLSVATALAHAIRSALPARKSGIAQKGVETSLIERFLYPRLGPGQMWEEVQRRVVAGGGQVSLNHAVVDLERSGDTVTRVCIRDLEGGVSSWIDCDAFISTMPIGDLVSLLRPESRDIQDVGRGLPHRDFKTVGLVVREMTAPDRHGRRVVAGTPKDNWIYIQEPDVKLGRLQIFNNWSPDLVADPRTVSLGLEYFCSQTDEVWTMDDGRFIDMAARELEQIGLISRDAVVDATVVNVPKAYPAYFGEYRHVGRVRDYLATMANVFAIGRNGMHRYNNQDHSMLAARAAVDCIASGSRDRSAIWSVNTEDDYHEAKS